MYDERTPSTPGMVWPGQSSSYHHQHHHRCSIVVDAMNVYAHGAHTHRLRHKYSKVSSPGNQNVSSLTIQRYDETHSQAQHGHYYVFRFGVSANQINMYQVKDYMRIGWKANKMRDKSEQTNKSRRIQHEWSAKTKNKKTQPTKPNSGCVWARAKENSRKKSELLETLNNRVYIGIRVFELCFFFLLFLLCFIPRQSLYREHTHSRPLHAPNDTHFEVWMHRTRMCSVLSQWQVMCRKRYKTR